MDKEDSERRYPETVLSRSIARSLQLRRSTNRNTDYDYSNLIVRNFSLLSFDAVKLRVTNIVNLINIRKYVQNDKYPFSVHRISTAFQSLDYEIPENLLMVNDEKRKGYPFIFKKNCLRWTIFLLIGVFTALAACTISVLIDNIIEHKFALISKMLDENKFDNQLYIPLLTWILLNIAPVGLSAYLICYIEPYAVGSGIPMVKCYLNGIYAKGFLNLRVLFIKMIAVAGVGIGSLACGKEGPMVHVGAIIGAGLAEWKIKIGKKEIHFFKYFSVDCEKREFVSAGAAAGVAAAFGGPVGGVLFCLEDGASFWNQSLTWRIFFSSVVSTFTLNFVLSAVHGNMGQQNYNGLMNLGHYDNFDYTIKELPIFIFMGIFGGCTGAIWAFLNCKIQSFRKTYVEINRFSRVIETILISAVTACVGFATTVYISTSCEAVGLKPAKHPATVYCDEGEMNIMASLWLQTPEETVKGFLHDDPNTYSPRSLIIFCFVYFFLSLWTAGMCAALGIVVAGLIIGAAWGRLFGQLFFRYLPAYLGKQSVSIGKFALIGACAQLGGFVRTTISLTVIIMETTRNTNIGFPVVVTLICAKWTADSFNRSVYENMTMLAGVPFLLSDCPPYLSHITACDVMSDSIVTVYTIDIVEDILSILEHTEHNGFPVVDHPFSIFDRKHNKFRGLILRRQLLVMLKNKIFEEYRPDWRGIILDDFDHEPKLSDIILTDREKKYNIDMRPYMNPSPYTTIYNCSLSRLYQIFRALGLRHLPVLDDSNHVIGMITRKDIAKYRYVRNCCSVGVEELYMSAS